jgi:hypothetical protein
MFKILSFRVQYFYQILIFFHGWNQQYIYIVHGKLFQACAPTVMWNEGAIVWWTSPDSGNWVSTLLSRLLFGDGCLSINVAWECMGVRLDVWGAVQGNSIDGYYWMGMEAKWRRRIMSDGTAIMGRVGLENGGSM